MTQGSCFERLRSPYAFAGHSLSATSAPIPWIGTRTLTYELVAEAIGRGDTGGTYHQRLTHTARTVVSKRARRERRELRTIVRSLPLRVKVPDGPPFEERKGMFEAEKMRSSTKLWIVAWLCGAACASGCDDGPIEPPEEISAPSADAGTNDTVDGSVAPTGDTDAGSIDSGNIDAGESCHQLTFQGSYNGRVGGQTEQCVTSAQSSTPVEALPRSGFTFSTWSDGNTEKPPSRRQSAASHDAARAV